MASGVVAVQEIISILLLAFAAEEQVEMLAILLEALQIQAVAAVVLAGLVHKQALLAVQVMHELLIGVNYGTTLRIS
jgi:hypothetical protein